MKDTLKETKQTAPEDSYPRLASELNKIIFAHAPTIMHAQTT